MTMTFFKKVSWLHTFEKNVQMLTDRWTDTRTDGQTEEHRKFLSWRCFRNWAKYYRLIQWSHLSNTSKKVHTCFLQKTFFQYCFTSLSKNIWEKLSWKRLIHTQQENNKNALLGYYAPKTHSIAERKFRVTVMFLAFEQTCTTLTAE